LPVRLRRAGGSSHPPDGQAQCCGACHKPETESSNCGAFPSAGQRFRLMAAPSVRPSPRICIPFLL
jgi:hypothetical protein